MQKIFFMNVENNLLFYLNCVFMIEVYWKGAREFSLQIESGSCPPEIGMPYFFFNLFI